ncbi:MAG: undecaprenyl-phosphate glucose phosphotransferase [Kiloniellales bacterium]|nr:undecaprenyl-phosphate glucose phosphotransferase [Kiloniellales bacterium]
MSWTDDVESGATLGSPALGGTAKPLSPILVGGLLRLLDAVCVALVGLGAFYLYVFEGVPERTGFYLGSIALGVAITLAIFQWSSVYDDEKVFAQRLRLDRVLTAWAVAFCVFLAIAFALKVTSTYSRVWAVSWFLTTPAVLAILRLLFSYWVSRLVREGRFASRTVIVGAGEHGQRLAAHLNAYGDSRIRLLGFIDDRQDRIPPVAEGYRLLGDTRHLVGLIQQGFVDQVFIALPWNAESRLLQLMQDLSTTPVQIRLAPDLVGFGLKNRSFTEVARLPMLKVFDRPITGWSHVAKTIEDQVLAILACIFVGPLMALIALAIKLDSSGPVLFRQQRYGFNNNLIEVWKFRTMYTHMADHGGHVQASRGDQRVTKVGAFLRRSSLDELPQLFNVLRGDMSLVGPRPHALDTRAQGRLFEEVVDRYAARHKVKPGITGWAQVNGYRGAADTVEKISRRVEYDLFYIDHWSIWFDLEILLRTVISVLKADNAY